MTNDNRTPEEIEREIEEQRSDLTSNLEDLQDKFSIDTLVRQVGDQFREHGGDLGRSISQQVKANPIALALTGAGLAWMMFGSQQRAQTGYDDDGYNRTERDDRATRLSQGRAYAPPASTQNSRRSAFADGPSWAREDDLYDTGDYGTGTSMTDRVKDGYAGAKDSAASGMDSVKSGASSAASSVSDAASTAGSRISDSASRAGSAISGGAASAVSTASDSAASARSAIDDGFDAVRTGVASARNRIADGTESLTEEGRKRVIAARYKAMELRRHSARQLADGRDAAADFYDRQPLVIGALALAVGAAIGGALPRTQTEDDLMGSQSDDLFSQAERIFEEEKSRALAVASSVTEEVRDIAAETKTDLDSGAPGDRTAAEAVADKAKSSARRVADAAKAEAEDKKLGKPKT